MERSEADEADEAEWSGVERSQAEWSGVERSGAELNEPKGLLPSQPTRGKGSCVIRETTQTGCPWSRPRVSLSIYLEIDLRRLGSGRVRAAFGDG